MKLADVVVVLLVAANIAVLVTNLSVLKKLQDLDEGLSPAKKIIGGVSQLFE